MKVTKCRLKELSSVGPGHVGNPLALGVPVELEVPWGHNDWLFGYYPRFALSLARL